MFKTIANAWKMADLRKKIIFTLFIVLLYRIGSNIPVPFVNLLGTDGLATDGGNIITYLSMMTGTAFNYGTLFALGVTPYINSSIIIQLLGVAIPALGNLQKEGEEGRKKIAAITRYVTILLAVLQSVAYYFYIKNSGSDFIAPNGLSTGATIFQAVVIVLCFTAGSALVMWLGEQINDKGIGNGISIILFAGIVSRLPSMLVQLWEYFRKGGAYYALSPIVLVCFIFMIAWIVWMDNAERRLPIQYAKRVVGRKMYGGQSTHMPIKVNMSGVLPVIFASSILSIPTTIQMFVNVKEGSGWEKFFNVFSSEHWPYSIIYFVLIIFFAYFYATIQYNPVEMANNLRKNGGVIPGIRVGKPTSDYIQKIISRITLLGALMLSVVALFPILFQLGTTAAKHAMQISLGGTSLIIVVGVALETVKQLESQMMMRHYRGFLD